MLQLFHSHNFENLLALSDNINVLVDAVDLLKNITAYNNKDLIFKGLSAIDVLSLHKSEDLVEKMFQAITNESPNFENNTDLKKCAIELMLRLLSHSNVMCKRYFIIVFLSLSRIYLM